MSCFPQFTRQRDFLPCLSLIVCLVLLRPIPAESAWQKTDNSIPPPSDNTSNNGRIALGTRGKGDERGALEPAVLKQTTGYKMWYAGQDQTAIRIYHATSPDSMTWTKVDNSIPANADTVSGNGRIPLGTAGKGDSAHVNAPCVIYDGSVYRLWYAGYDGVHYRIYCATSPDGLTWNKIDNSVPSNSDTILDNGRIALGTVGKGDSFHVYGPSVIQDGSTYKMWYAGYDGRNYRIFCATSPDGMTWTKSDNSIPAASDNTCNGRISLGTAGRGDSFHVYDPVVLKDSSSYKMWYAGHDGKNYRIFHATSPDGMTWTKQGNSIPANSDAASGNTGMSLGTAGRGDSFHVRASSVIKDGMTYKMWYSGHDGVTFRIYHAASD